LKALPEWDNPSLAGNYPSWVYEFYQREKGSQKLLHKISKSKFLPIFIIEKINKRDFFPPEEIKKISRNYDLVFTSGKNIISALNFDIPVVFRSLGSDMARLPFSCGNLYQEALSYTLRKRIKKISCIIAQQEDTIWSARFLGVLDKLRFFPIPVDIDDINANTDKDLLRKLNEKYSSYDHVFFLPARKVINPNHSAYKGAEKFLKAFKKLKHKHKNIDIKVVSIMRGSGDGNFRRLIKSMQLEKYFDHIEGILPTYKLSAYMKIRNCVVFDDFGFTNKTHLTGISREALSVGAVVVDIVDTEYSHFKRLYRKNCPLLHADDEEAIFKQMERIVSMDSNELENIRKRSISWAYKHLHWEKRIDELIDILEEHVEH